MLMNLVDYVFSAAHRDDRWAHPALVCDDAEVSYADLHSSVRRFASGLRRLGVAPGERVAVVARDCPEFVVAFLGTAAAGSIAVPVSTMATEAELEYVLGHCGATAAVVTSEQLEKLRAARRSLPALARVLLVDGEPGANELAFGAALGTEAEIAPVDDDALALILYTSGSTGRPKGATHRHANLPATVEGYGRRVLRVRPDDRLFSSSRLFFAYGLGNSLSFPLSAGATSILCRERPTPAVVADVFRRHRPTIFFAVPAVFNALVAAADGGLDLDTSSLRTCVSAGEMLPERSHHEWLRRTGLEILDAIGSTEMLHMFISNDHGEVRPGSSGRPVPGCEARLVDVAGADVEGAGAGDLLVRGPSASPGYWNDPEKTAATMVDGWVRTGDVYRRDEDGYYWFEGRSDDLFKVKGLWVSPVEVEEALLACGGVREAAVVAGTGEDGTTAAVAFVALAEEAEREGAAERLTHEVRSRLPSYKCPGVIRFVDALPRTATGKVQRFRLRGVLSAEC
jgi:4-hydroxybenzoate-CoA ligase